MWSASGVPGGGKAGAGRHFSSLPHSSSSQQPLRPQLWINWCLPKHHNKEIGLANGVLGEDQHLLVCQGKEVPILTS